MRVLLAILLLSSLLSLAALAKPKYTGLKNAITVSDLKEWKKLLRSRNNVLALFANGKKYVSDMLPVFEEVASNTRGRGTLLFVDCSADGKKMCKNLKVKPSLYAMKHYKNGAFHKDYDRLLEVKSMISFMGNPSADPPWSEDPSASSIRHVEGPHELENLLRVEKKPVLMFFYAPWCGHCKKMKPEMAAAAAEVKDQYVLAGMDVDTPDAFGIREQFNITGFPTIIYFENGQRKFDYSGKPRRLPVCWFSSN
jgi:thiol-disulfide isomerase/thioredoxin